MKVFTCTKFTGVWPVGTAAVVSARDKECAASILNEELKAQGLKGDATPEMMEEFQVSIYENVTAVRVLCNGEY